MLTFLASIDDEMSFWEYFKIDVIFFSLISLLSLNPRGFGPQLQNTGSASEAGLLIGLDVFFISCPLFLRK